MNATRLREIRTEAQAHRLAQRAVDGSGTRRAVGRRWGRTESTISHYTGNKVCPEFRDAIRLTLRLAAGSETDQTTARAFRDAVDEAYRLGELEPTDTPTILARAVWLHDRENELEAAENRSAILSRHERREALRAEAWAQLEYADLDEILEGRGAPDPRSVIRKGAA